MQREVATQWQDLPHVFRPTTQLRATRDVRCDCGRVLGDELHTGDPVEKASAGGEPLPTLKGS